MIVVIKSKFECQNGQKKKTDPNLNCVTIAKCLPTGNEWKHVRS